MERVDFISFETTVQCSPPNFDKMASAQSLLGLVNQLQTMESSFCDVLMEAALKLASLTGEYIIYL